MSASWFHNTFLISAICIWVGGVFAADAPQPMVVHEWGTFTALEDDNGLQLLGINVDTEPVPKFVHNLGRFVLNDAVLTSQHWIHKQKAVPRNHPQVSLRLETPVIYFYPPKGAKLPLTVEVKVKFRGGWLTEFYPQPEIRFPVVQNGKFEFSNLTPETLGYITWRDLQVGTDGMEPYTNEHVWLAPRKVAAAGVTTPGGEHEKYLFYRGVAQQVAPLRVITENQRESLTFSANFSGILKENQRISIKDLWLVEARADGTCAYRRLEALPVANVGNEAPRITSARHFADAEFDSGNRTGLEQEMNEALIREGLFADEAKALLSTWQQAYFISPGLRVFYTVPREWTDYYLPLTISGDPKITRVMIGRVELISDTQRELLNRLAKSSISKPDWLMKFQHDPQALKKLLAGNSNIDDFEQFIPSDFRMYLDLGRFRNALVAAEEARTKSPNLAQFIREYKLEPFRLSQESGK